MKCRRCDQDMNLWGHYDTGTYGHPIDDNIYKFDIFVCVDCGRVMKCDSGHNAGVLYIDYDNIVTTGKGIKIIE